ncbi:MAG: LacI family DNA-binding transcriptional regulator [Anaerolineales bacterium]
MARTARRSHEKITILDVAKKAGVSFGTVSRVLNDDVHVKPETRKRVLEAIDRLGFVANRHARILAGGKAGTIGVLVPDLGSEYIAEIMRGVDAEIGLAGRDLILYTTHRDPKKEAAYVATCLDGMADGMLLVLPRNPSDFVPRFVKRKFPFVLIDHQGAGKDTAAVGVANRQGGYNATEYLIGLGHRRIGFITGWKDVEAAQNRLKGYQAALRTHRIAEDPDLIFEGTFAQADGYNGGHHFLKLNNPPTAVFASNDVMAMGVMDAAREHNLRIPEDLSVIGFDDSRQASDLHPALTTVRQPLEKMGRVASQMLLEMLRNPGARIDRIELPAELVIRDSCSKVKV